MLVALPICAGILYHGEGSRSITSTPRPHVQQSEKDSRNATQLQKEEETERARRAEQEKEEKRRQKEQEARRKAEQRKAELRADAYLLYAKKLASEGQTEKARERLQEIVRDLPNTEAAKEARHLLQTLPP